MAPKASKNDYLKLTFQLQKFFRQAVAQNDLVTVKRITKYHGSSINLNSMNDEGVSAIHQCCIDGNHKMLSVLLKAGANINIQDPEGWTCLHACSATGNFALTEYLLRKGANSVLRNANTELAIDLSEDVGVTYALSMSMKARGYISLANSYLKGLQVLQYHKEDVDTSAYAIRGKVSGNHRGNPTSILKRHSTGSASNRLSISSSSSSEESEVDERCSKRFSVQFSANTLFRNYVHENEYEKLRSLLKSSKCSVSVLNKLDRKGLSAIHWASVNGYPECVEILANFGADIEKTDPNGWTPLHAAVVTNNSECVEKLLKFDANAYAITSNGESVFDLISSDGILELLQGHAAYKIQNEDLPTTQI